MLEWIVANAVPALTMIATAGAVYGGLKSDLKSMELRFQIHSDQWDKRFDVMMAEIMYQRAQIDQMKNSK